MNVESISGLRGICGSIAVSGGLVLTFACGSHRTPPLPTSAPVSCSAASGVQRDASGHLVLSHQQAEVSPGPLQRTQWLVCALSPAVQLYRERTGTYPNVLRQLVGFDFGGAYPPISVDMMRDDWGHELRLSVRNDERLVHSAGPDGQFGSDDDLYAIAAVPTSR